jgi:hypothetical protein
LEDIMRSDFSSRTDTLLKHLGVSPKDTDLIVDLYTPAYEPYNAFATALVAALQNIDHLDSYRSFVVIGTAFPDSMAEVSPPGGDIKRHDWKFYEELLKTLPKDMRRPNFGDYTTVHPTFVAIDMRKIKPAGKIIYTNKDHWHIRKGGAFRDNPDQMHGHCEHIVKYVNFRGAAFSDGDNYIEHCAKKAAGYGPSSQTRWKEVAISHHTMHVLEDLAKLDGQP